MPPGGVLISVYGQRRGEGVVYAFKDGGSRGIVHDVISVEDVCDSIRG